MPTKTRPRRSAERHAHPPSEVLLPAERVALACDDEEMLRTLSAHILEEEGFVVVQAENGQRALKIAERMGRRISLVLLDLLMPVMDGATALPRLRAVLSDVPILLMTRLPTPEIDQPAEGLVADARLPNPFTFDRLTGAIRPAAAELDAEAAPYMPGPGS